jgi:hypothetical protein
MSDLELHPEYIRMYQIVMEIFNNNFKEDWLNIVHNIHLDSNIAIKYLFAEQH